MKEVFTTAEIRRALDLWAAGKNTVEIALALNVTEAAIHNCLYKWRAERKKAVAA